jgi:poly(hydroxyalkanoate) granule-associated protein
MQERTSVMGDTARVIVERWLNAVVSGDTKSADAAPDVRLHGIGAPVSGRAAVSFVLGSLRTAFPDLQVESEVLAAEGSRVAVRITAKGTQQIPVFGLRPGEVRQAAGMGCFCVGDAGITDVWLYVDAGQLVQQLGLQPARSASDGGENGEPQESWRDRVAGSTRDVWLAGLGALVAAGEQGERLFHMLVDQGRKLETSGRAAASDGSEKGEAAAASLTERAREAASTGQEYLRDAAVAIRRRLDWPAREEFEELRRKVDQLLTRTEPTPPPPTSVVGNPSESERG